MYHVDVAILGGGLAGLTAAYNLRDYEIEVLDANAHVGGRTRSIPLEGGRWANLGAQYVSPDKVRVAELCEEMGLEMVPIGHLDVFDRMIEALSARDRAALERSIAALETEQAEHGPVSLPELDETTFSEWLGKLEELPPAVERWWTFWCENLVGSPVETSLYGAMLLWGEDRVSPFKGGAVPTHDKGDCVIRGGTNELTKALARAAGDRVSLRTRVIDVARLDDKFRIVAQDDDGLREISARAVISALPAPVATDVLDVPGWKREALRSVRYGRWIATPLEILPKDSMAHGVETTFCRHGAVYNSNVFALRTPTDFDRDGGCLHSYLVDVHARAVWDDPPHTIQTGAMEQLLHDHPEYEGRVRPVGFQRWEHALPLYAPGKQMRLEQLQASAGGIHFCGDYTSFHNMDGAAQSGDRAAAEVLKHL